VTTYSQLIHLHYSRTHHQTSSHLVDAKPSQECSLCTCLPGSLSCCPGISIRGANHGRSECAVPLVLRYATSAFVVAAFVGTKGHPTEQTQLWIRTSGWPTSSSHDPSAGLSFQLALVSANLTTLSSLKGFHIICQSVDIFTSSTACHRFIHVSVTKRVSIRLSKSRSTSGTLVKAFLTSTSRSGGPAMAWSKTEPGDTSCCLLPWDKQTAERLIMVVMITQSLLVLRNASSLRKIPADGSCEQEVDQSRVVVDIRARSVEYLAVVTKASTCQTWYVGVNIPCIYRESTLHQNICRPHSASRLH
jgi:hypothetical protein